MESNEKNFHSSLEIIRKWQQALRELNSKASGTRKRAQAKEVDQAGTVAKWRGQGGAAPATPRRGREAPRLSDLVFLN